ncbi:MAG: hypothetical protein NTT76_04285 [Achromobacter xylosoxidans]|nr:hypothetical protein [Achromobacter xylosoxidans]
MAFVFMRRRGAGLRRRQRAALRWGRWGLTGCAGGEPRIGDAYTVHTPIYADNRIFYRKEFPKALGSEEAFPLLRGLNACHRLQPPLAELDAFLTHYATPGGKKCAARS